MKINIISEREFSKCHQYGVWPTKQELYDMYCNKGMNMYQIADELGCAQTTVCRMMYEYNIPSRSISDACRRYSLNESFFKFWNHNMSYVLGVICADGCIHNSLNRVVISSKDKKWLYDIRNIMLSDYIINKDKNGVYHLGINSFKIIQDLLHLGITPNKSLTLEFPNVPEEFMSSYIRGVFDGDGSVFLLNVQNSIVANISSGSDKFTLKLQSVLHENVINSYLWQWYGQLCGIRLSKKSEVKKFYDFIYQHDGIFLKRKKDIFDKFFNGVDV